MDRSPEALQARLSEARRLIEDQRLEEAAASLLALVEDFPGYIQPKHDLAVAFKQMGALDAALALFVEVSERNDYCLNSPDLHAVLTALPDQDRAIATAEALLRRHPKYSLLIHVLGQLLRRRATARGEPPEDITVVGDSHSITSFATIPRCAVHHIGAFTMHRVARDSLDLAGLGIGPGASVVAVFGEIDCRCHLVGVAERAGIAPAEAARMLGLGFVGRLRQVVAQAGLARLAICGVLPPLKIPHVENPEYPLVGSPSERRDVAAVLNRTLAEAAREAGIGFLDIAPAYSTAEGFLEPTLSDEHVHVSCLHTGPIAAALEAWMGPPARQT